MVDNQRPGASERALSLAFRLATLDDAEAIMGLLEAAAEWLVSRGIRQWLPGQIRMDWLRERIADGEVYVATLDGELAGSFRLIWSDEPVWGTTPDDAGYAHGLVINRAFAGRGVGLRLLERAEQLVAARGRPYLRLDCMTANAVLCDYYVRAGFTYRGDKHGTTWSASRFEKRVEDMAEGALVMTRATPDEVDTAVAIENSATSWLRSRGIEPGEPPRPLRDIIAECVARGEVFLGKRDGVAAGKIILQELDDGVWGEMPENALYIHGFMVHRAFAGQGVGLAMLRWAEYVAGQRGKTLLRLDCDATNPALRAYYERSGFTSQGDVRLAHRVAARYQRYVGTDGQGK